jgi:hypothetical protein
MDMTDENLVLSTNKHKSNYTEHFVIEMPAFEALNLCTLIASTLNVTATYLLTYLLTPWSRVLLEKLTGCS